MTLNEEQVKELQEHNWEVAPAPAYLNLFRYDFHKESDWKQICEQLNIPKDYDSVTILYVAKMLPKKIIL
jgi:hypothetical protein